MDPRNGLQPLGVNFLLAAVGHGLCDILVFFCALEQRRRPDSRTRNVVHIILESVSLIAESQ
jgi:hypothetical protein